jgi:hypothetical protein
MEVVTSTIGKRSVWLVWLGPWSPALTANPLPSRDSAPRLVVMTGPQRARRGCVPANASPSTVVSRPFVGRLSWEVIDGAVLGLSLPNER